MDNGQLGSWGGGGGGGVWRTRAGLLYRGLSDVS